MSATPFRSRSGRRSPLIRHATCFVLGAFLAVCSGSAEDAEPPPAKDVRREISWLGVDLDEALVVAKESGKPLFLYWTAEWCPPCHYLSNKVFKRPEFVERMGGFVAVYLDADASGAQFAAERLRVAGFPTVILMSPEGEELMRLPSTLPTERWPEMLDLGLRRHLPLDRTVERILVGGVEAASSEDLELLAFHDWAQDRRVELTLRERAELMRTLHRHTPPSAAVERSRFAARYLMAISESGEGTDSPMEETERERWRAELIGILEVPALRTANLDAVLYDAIPVIDLLAPSAGETRAALRASWERAAIAIECDEALAVTDRLGATLLRIDLARQGEPGGDELPASELPADVVAHARRQVAWASSVASGESELQTVVNRMAYVLERVGRIDEAEELLHAYMDGTPAPYYFVSWIAELRDDAGESEAALALYRRAWEEARGGYTRFRWGAGYLTRLMEVWPQRTDLIEEDSIAVLSDLLVLDDAFAGPNRERLSRLERAFGEWADGGGDRRVVVERVAALVAEACGRRRATGTDSIAVGCEDLFSVPPR